MPEESPSAAATAMSRPKVTIADRLTNPEETLGSQGNRHITFYAVCAILATLAFAGTALLCWMDYNQLSMT